ncbi:ATP synthase F1 subunit gamma [Candidatus Kaiserbacteria bacterium RIFCSPLOWO2_01_FULL_54_24]|uniref:ATP synthase gamma chain n=1 Tax=Candidatus Kaiserbacteria bacterium RIFCSPLOWO2_01_FULL_54_24 TaxID=1798515 RepID=A0A1F6EUC2_9BACT|nr:MAG: ATP synthase F1 subunit gamma [Candidatus Kaiserbacteria bacterium RIFCSPLOWO2_01_FULL_54_24]
MAGLKQIKTKIVAMKKSQTVTKAMEAVSAAKMRKSQQTALNGRAYARAAASVLSRVAGSRELLSHPLARPNTASGKRALYIVITSDKGLAGALNSGVLKAAARDIAEAGHAPKDAAIIAVGRKAHDYFAARGYPVEGFYPNTTEVTGETVRTIVDTAAARFMSGEYKVVKIAYQNFISTFEQRPTLRTVFPLSLADLERVVGDITPAKGAFAAGQTSDVRPSTYTLEPSQEEVLGVILPMLASVIVYHALLESQASEHSARMVAMKSASDKAAEKQDELTLVFNKARQAAITREVSEIIGGMEALVS